MDEQTYYGNQQSQMTMNRMAYGDVPAAMMMGAGTVYGGAAQGMGNMLSDIGSRVMPVMYAPPARVHAGYYGMYQQHTGLMRGIADMVGLGSVPRGTTAQEYGNSLAGDVGARIGGGMVGLGLAGVAAASAMLPGVGFIGSMALYAGASMVTGAVQRAAGQRSEIQNFIESTSFRYVGAGSSMADPRMGSGMNVQSRQQMGDMIRKMDVKDPYLNTEDLTNILKSGTQLGMFTGTQDIDDFKKKFKDITESVKTVTKVLHQTLEDGMKTLKDLRTIGVDPSQSQSLVMQADALGKVAGRTGAEMIGVAMQGAEMFRGTGVTMQIGAQASMMNLAAIRASRDAGLLSQEAVAQAGGEEALAMRQTASGLAFGQSQMGRGMGAAFMGPGGTFNSQNFMGQMMGGGSFIGMAQQAAGNLSSPAAMIAYQANQEKFMSDMGKQFGGRGLEIAQTMTGAAYATFMSSQTHAKFEDSFRMVLKEQGLSATDIDSRIAQARGAGQIYETQQAAAHATANKLVMEEASQNSLGIRVKGAVKGALVSAFDVVAKPARHLIDETSEGARRLWAEEVLGTQTGTTAGVDISRRIYKGDATLKGPIDLDRGGKLSFSTTGTSGAQLADILKDKEFSDMLGIKTTYGAAKDGDVILKHGGYDSTNISAADLKRASAQAKVLSMTSAEADTMKERGELRGMEGRLGEALDKGLMKKDMSFTELAKAFYGDAAFTKDGKLNLSSKQMAEMNVELRNTQWGDTLTKVQTKGKIMRNSQDAMTVANLVTARAGYDKAVGNVNASLGVELKGKDADKVALLIAEASQETDPDKKKALVKQAMDAVVQTGAHVDPAKLKTAVTKAASSSDAVAVARGHDAMLDNRVNEGQVEQVNAALAEIDAAKLSPNVDKTELKNQVTKALVDKSGHGLAALADDKNMPADIRARGQGAKRLLALTSKSADRDIQNAIIGVGIDTKDPNYQKMFDEVKAGHTDVVMQTSMELSAKKTSGTTQTSGPGAATGAQPTAADVLQQQTNINQQILSAMTAVAIRLGK